MKEPYRIYIRNLTLYVILVNLFTLGLAALVLNSSLQQYHERAKITVENLASVLEENLSGLYQKIDLTLLAATDEASERLCETGECSLSMHDYLVQMHSRLPEVSSLRVVDVNGEVGEGAGDAKQGSVSVADRDYFQRLSQDPGAGLFVSAPSMGRISRNLVVNFARRVNALNGSFVGVVYASMPLSYLAAKFSVLNIGKNGIATLWSQDKTVVVRFPDPAMGTTYTGGGLPSAPLREFIDSGQKSLIYKSLSNFDGRTRLLCARRLAGFPYIVNVGLDEDEYLAPWRDEVRHAGSMAAILCLLTLVSAWMIFRSLKRQSATMLGLEAAKNELESRVSERTQQLSATVDELKHAKERAESADRMKSEFLANVSHELKTPLNPIVAFTDVTLGGELAPEQRENLREVKDAAQKLHEMIDSLIELTSLESRQVRQEPICPQSVVETLARDITLLAKAKGLGFSWSIDPEVPLFVLGDQKLIGIMLAKLCENAVKFTDKGEISLRLSLKDDNPERPCLCFRVQDSGAGIDPERLPGILGGLSQGDAPLTKRHRGLGIGMATLQKILALLGGCLEVQSVPGQGSIFTACLPFNPADEV